MHIPSAKKSPISNISPPYPLVTTPKLTDNTSTPPHHLVILYIIILVILFHSQLPSLSSPPFMHNSNSPEDTNFENSSNIFLIHSKCQSTKIYPATLFHMNFDDIPIPSVDSLSNQPDSPVKTFASFRFPPE